MGCQRRVTWRMGLWITGCIAADLLCIFRLRIGLGLIVGEEEPPVLRVARVVAVGAGAAVLRAPGRRLLCGLRGVIGRGDPAGVSVRGLGPAEIRVSVLRHLRVHDTVCIRMIRWVEVITYWHLPIRHSVVRWTQSRKQMCRVGPINGLLNTRLQKPKGLDYPRKRMTVTALLLIVPQTPWHDIARRSWFIKPGEREWVGRNCDEMLGPIRCKFWEAAATPSLHIYLGHIYSYYIFMWRFRFYIFNYCLAYILRKLSWK